MFTNILLFRISIVILSSSARYLLSRFSKRSAYLDRTVLLDLPKFPSNMWIGLAISLHISSTCVSLLRSFHASGKLHASHPSLKSTIQNRTQTIDRSLYFSRSPRSSSVWCSNDLSTILMNNLYHSQESRASGKDGPPQLFCSVFGTILFGPWRGVRSPWWSWQTIRRHLIP